MSSSTLTSSLSETLLGVVFSYCNASDFVQLLETGDATLTQAVRLALSNASSLHCSFLLELDQCRNHGNCSKKNARKEQEACILQLLSNVTHNTAKLKRLELTGLRHVVGNQGNWLNRLFRGSLATTLTSIDFSSCAMLDPRLVHAALVPPRSNNNNSEEEASTGTLLHLQFQGCYRIDAPIVMVIATSPRFAQLQSLSLRGCSQSIGDECVHAIITNLHHLRCLDLSGLKHITEQASMLFQFLPETMASLELAGCELLRFTQLLVWGRQFLQEIEQGHQHQQHQMDPTQLSANFWQEHPQLLNSCPPKARVPLPNLTRINFNGIGTPRRGLVSGALPYFALRSMGSLREVYLSGCEHIRDWEVKVLAMSCGQNLTCLEMRACCIGNDAVRALGLYCTQLADVDFSACFEISDEGIVAFCQYQGAFEKACSVSSGTASTQTQWTKRRVVPAFSTLRSLKIAALPQLTNESVRAVAALHSLLLLDVSNCPKVTSEALAGTVKELSSLIDVNAKGIGKWSSSVAALYSYEDDEPRHLRFVNGRRFQNKSTTTSTKQPGEVNCLEHCIVRQHGKRFDPTQGVPLQPMYHCLDCRLIPCLNRGMCHSCSVHCHKDHQTFVGSYTRFYCDCPFGIAGAMSACQRM